MAWLHRDKANKKSAKENPVEKEQKIIASLLTGLPRETRRMLIITIKICDTFQTQLERHQEIEFSAIHAIIRNNEKKAIAYKIAEMMGLELIERKKTPEARRKGKAWVKK